MQSSRTLKSFIILIAFFALSGCYDDFEFTTDRFYELNPSDIGKILSLEKNKYVLGKVNSKCDGKEDKKVCLFEDNPSVDTLSESEGALNFEVNLSQFAEGSFLKNSYLKVVKEDKDPVRLSTTLKSLKSDPKSELNSYASAFYWANHILTKFERESGHVVMHDRNIDMIVGEHYSSWFSKENKFFVQAKRHKGISYVDRDVLAYLLGTVMVQLSVTQKEGVLSVESESQCGSGLLDRCCKYSGGCFSALKSGLAEYFAHMVFSRWRNINEGDLSPNESVNCSLKKDGPVPVVANLNLAFSKCSVEGSIYPMGSLFSGALWKAREKSGDISEFDQLYIVGLNALEREDNFYTFSRKLQIIDENFFDGRFWAVLNSQFRGIGIEQLDTFASTR